MHLLDTAGWPFTIPVVLVFRVSPWRLLTSDGAGMEERPRPVFDRPMAIRPVDEKSGIRIGVSLSNADAGI